MDWLSVGVLALMALLLIVASYAVGYWNGAEWMAGIWQEAMLREKGGVMDEQWANRACRLCAYWDKPTSADVGGCRVVPPKTVGPGTGWGRWPVTDGVGWCGKFWYDPTKEECNANQGD